MRYERKYRITGRTTTQIESHILRHPACFRPLFPERQIHSIYFDTPDWQAFQANQEGDPFRQKWRVRWYNHCAPVQAPTLEIKYKQHALGYKKRIPLMPFRLPQHAALQTQVEQHLPHLALRPVLLISYTRQYWLSACRRFRLTLDRQLRFAPPPLQNHFAYLTQDDALILELKYEQIHAPQADFILQKLPFRLSKNSKYSQGITALYRL